MTCALLGRTPGRCWSPTSGSAASAPARPAGSGGPGCGSPGCPRPGRPRPGRPGSSAPAPWARWGPAALAALLQAARRLGAGQLDDPAALVLGQPPRHTRAGQVGQPVQPLGSVEAVQPLVYRLGVAAEPLGELGDADAVPACGDDAGALDQAGGSVAGAGEPAQGAFLDRVGRWSGIQRRPGHVSPSPAQRRHDEHKRQANYTALKERSTSLIATYPHLEPAPVGASRLGWCQRIMPLEAGRAGEHW